MSATDQQVRAGSRLRRTAALAVLALMTQACMLSTEMDLDIRNDGSGTADLLLQYDDTMAGLLGGADQLLRELDGPDADDLELLTADDLESPYTQGLRYRASFDDPDQLREVLLDGPFDDADVDLADGVLRIDASVDGDEFGSPDEFGFDGVVRAIVVVNIDVQGDVTSANSTSTSGSVHTWEFDLARGGGDLLLTAELGGGGSLLPILAALVVLLLLGGIGVVVLRTQRGGGSGQASGPGQVFSAQTAAPEPAPPGGASQPGPVAGGSGTATSAQGHQPPPPVATPAAGATPPPPPPGTQPPPPGTQPSSSGTQPPSSGTQPPPPGSGGPEPS